MDLELRAQKRAKRLFKPFPSAALDSGSHTALTTDGTAPVGLCPGLTVGDVSQSS